MHLPHSMLLLLLLPSLLFVACDAAPEADRVQILPGLRYQPAFKHYSGYLKAGGDRHLHYWFVESSQVPSADAPLVLWFNGGPGCSSMEGFLREHGPFIVNDQAWLNENPHAWNRLANVLYIEAPAGVGFSYSDSGVTATNDTQVAEDNYLALVDFLKKFPEFVGRELHVSGESYGGVYVPTLAARILRDKSMKLKGILIGNGIQSWSLNSLSLLYFGYYHGLIGDQLWSQMRAACCDACDVRCDFFAGQSRAGCSQLLNEASTNVTDNLDIYNLYKPCHGGIGVQELYTFDSVRMYWKSRLSVSSRQLARRFLFANPAVNSGSLRLGLTPPCTNDTALTTYLNMPIVRQALHIKPGLDPFEVCANINYTMVYKDMTPVYRELIAADLPITLYNGDVDMACNFLQTDWFLQSLNMTLKTPKKAWYYQHPTEGRQIGGFVQQWKTGITFLTVRGSGHMVPEDKPEQALQLFSNHLSGDNY